MKPKLTLRDLFWLVLVCGLALGWWVDRTSNYPKVQEAVEKANAAQLRLQRCQQAVFEGGFMIQPDGAKQKLVPREDSPRALFNTQ